MPPYSIAVPAARAVQVATSVLALLLASASAAAQCAASVVADPAATAWSAKVIGALVGQNACFEDKSAFTNSDCNVFAAQVLERGYGIADFVNPSGPATAGGRLRYYTSGEMALLLWTTLSNRWESLGRMTDPSAIAKAQQRAFEGKPVVAVWRNPGSGPGHVALIGPGPLTPSTSHGSSTPVSASFFQGQPAKNYVGKPLACAFTPAQAPTVGLFARK